MNSNDVTAQEPAAHLLTGAQYNAARDRMFDAGDAAAAAIPFDAKRFKGLQEGVELTRAHRRALNERLFDASATEFVRLNQRINLAAAKLDRMDAELLDLHVAFRAGFDARQRAYVFHAKTRLQAWIDEGVIQMYAPQPGSPQLTVTLNHDDVVAAAIEAGRVVPDHVLAEYPALQSVALALTEAGVARHSEPERQRA